MNNPITQLAQWLTAIRTRRALNRHNRRALHLTARAAERIQLGCFNAKPYLFVDGEPVLPFDKIQGYCDLIEEGRQDNVSWNIQHARQ